MAMETSGGILQRVRHLSSSGGKLRWGGGESSSPSMRTSRVKTRRVCFPLGGFVDNGHADYYDRGGKVRCEGKKGKDKGVLLSSLKKKKKELKLLKGLTKDPSLFSEMGFEETQGKVISEAVELLTKQFEQMRAEEKELKRQRKGEKAKLKAMEDSDSESSSSSSSSESDCDEVINGRSFRSKSVGQSCVAQTHQIAGEKVAQPAMPGSADAVLIAPWNSIPAISSWPAPLDVNATQIQITSSQSCDLAKLAETLTASTKRIEVCMGGKCKKSGAVELLEEFERVVGVEGSVIGCKCMGRCKDGPNVRVSSCTSDKDRADVAVDKSAKHSSDLPLCIGVGLEDVGLIVTKFLEGDGNDANLAAITSML